MKNILNFIILLLTLISCKNSGIGDSPVLKYPLKIQLDLNDATVDSMNLSDIALDIEYIPLQTTDSALLGYFWDFGVTTNYYFIKDGSDILVFDKNGQYVSNLFKVGVGPGEAFAYCFTVDEKNELVYVYDNKSINVKIFNFNGKYIKTINSPIAPYEYWTYSIGYFNNYLFVHTAQRPFVKYLYSCFNLRNDSINILYKNHREYDKSQENKSPLAPLDYHYQITDSSILFKERFSDTIISANKNLDQYPRYIVGLGEQKLDWLGWRDHGMFNIAGGPPPGYQVQSFVETKSFLFLVLKSFREPQIFVVFNKTTNKAGIFKNTEVKTNAQVWVKNDLDGIAPFTPMNRSGYLFYHDDCLYCVLEAKEFSDAYGTASEQNKTSTKYLRKMAPAFSSVNEFSNPVIMKVHLK